jgi:hypothetical protein
MAMAPGKIATAANRLGLDYRREAARLGPPPGGAPMIDVHCHVAGAQASPIFAEAARLYGVNRVYSQTALGGARVVKDLLGDFVRFVAVPNFRSPDRAHAWRQGFLDDIRAFHGEFGSRIVKLWNAPRLREFFPDNTGADLIEFDSPWRVKAAELAQELGMIIMVHVADPDTWFKTKYADAAKYKTKLDHYAPLERMIDRFPGPWIAAHMGGWPEDLSFLDGLLSRHPNLHLDTSATKWVVREISKHPREAVIAFMTKWKGRILFGSDVVTTDEHLDPAKLEGGHPMAHLASGPAEAFDLYASRYWALRTLWETTHVGPSPIADPDLAMVEPGKFDAMSAPELHGAGLPPDTLRAMYHDAASALLRRVGAE